MVVLSCCPKRLKIYICREAESVQLLRLCIGNCTCHCLDSVLRLKARDTLASSAEGFGCRCERLKEGWATFRRAGSRRQYGYTSSRQEEKNEREVFNHTSLAGCYSSVYLSAASLCPRIDITRGQELWVFLPVSPESRTAAAPKYGKHLLNECQTLLKILAMAKIKHPRC